MEKQIPNHIIKDSELYVVSQINPKLLCCDNQNFSNSNSLLTLDDYYQIIAVDLNLQVQPS